KCAGCSAALRDRHVIRIRGRFWHEPCAICSVCASELADFCFIHDGLLFCRQDYYRLHARRCHACQQPMLSHELYMQTQAPISILQGEANPVEAIPLSSPPSASTCAEAKDSLDTHLVADTPQSSNSALLLFHVSCFACAVCRQPIAPGDSYTFAQIPPDSGIISGTGRPAKDGLAKKFDIGGRTQVPPNHHLICKTDYLRLMREKSQHQQYSKQLPSEAVSSATSSNPCSEMMAGLAPIDLSGVGQSESTGLAGKRARTTLNHEQRCRFQAIFDNNPRPQRKV
ncbi:unnamed protein product, partial [Protopolystoma xenopodis]